MNLTIFNVEHGACAILACNNGNTILIDCGHKSDWLPGEYLKQLGIRHLTMLVVTNYDEDHVSGLPNLYSSIDFQWLQRNPTVSSTQLLRLKSETGAGPGIKLLSNIIQSIEQNPSPPFNIDEINRNLFPGVGLATFYNPYPIFEDENNLSLVFAICIQGVTFLFTGDLEKNGWKYLLENSYDFRQQVKEVNVLIASHHGRESGIYEELFDVYGCNPALVVISDDCHKYDTQKTTAYYASKCSGITGFRNQSKRWVLTTRNDGDISFDFTSAGCIVS